jgi:hypothetical protein
MPRAIVGRPSEEQRTRWAERSAERKVQRELYRAGFQDMWERRVAANNERIDARNSERDRVAALREGQRTERAAARRRDAEERRASRERAYELREAEYSARESAREAEYDRLVERMAEERRKRADERWLTREKAWLARPVRELKTIPYRGGRGKGAPAHGQGAQPVRC